MIANCVFCAGTGEAMRLITQSGEGWEFVSCPCRTGYVRYHSVDYKVLMEKVIARFLESVNGKKAKSSELERLKLESLKN